MARVVVLHSYYGCDTGCCGHVVELEDDNGKESSKFEFTHPYDKKTEEEKIEWAKDLVRETFGEEHVKDLVWEECNIYYD